MKRSMHIVTLSFDDGFLKSDLKIAEIYEQHGVSACFNVIAAGHLDSGLAPLVAALTRFQLCMAVDTDHHGAGNIT